jgi:hypothetical protein
MKGASRLIIPAGAALVVLLLLVFRSFVMAIFIQPVALLLWALWRALASIDQQVYWIAIIILCAGLALQLVPTEARGSAASTYKYHYPQPSRLKAWQVLITRAAGKDDAEAMHAAARKLLLSVIASTEHAERMDAGLPEAYGELDLPPAALRLLLETSGNHDRSEASRFPRALASPFSRLHRRLSGRPSDDEMLLSQALSWMESRMEMDDDP